jgi:hypothetical protein
MKSTDRDCRKNGHLWELTYGFSKSYYFGGYFLCLRCGGMMQTNPPKETHIKRP